MRIKVDVYLKGESSKKQPKKVLHVIKENGDLSTKYTIRDLIHDVHKRCSLSKPINMWRCYMDNYEIDHSLGTSDCLKDLDSISLKLFKTGDVKEENDHENANTDLTNEISKEDKNSKDKIKDQKDSDKMKKKKKKKNDTTQDIENNHDLVPKVTLKDVSKAKHEALKNEEQCKAQIYDKLDDRFEKQDLEAKSIEKPLTKNQKRNLRKRKLKESLKTSETVRDLAKDRTDDTSINDNKASRASSKLKPNFFVTQVDVSSINIPDYSAEFNDKYNQNYVNNQINTNQYEHTDWNQDSRTTNIAEIGGTEAFYHTLETKKKDFEVQSQIDKQDVKDYSNMIKLDPKTAILMPNQIIAFKIIELSPDYSPVISDYKEAQVIAFDTHTSKITYKLLTPPTKRTLSELDGNEESNMGKFEIKQEALIDEVDGTMVEFVTEDKSEIFEVYLESFHELRLVK